MRSVHSSKITFGDVEIPVKIYKARDDYKLDSSLFHDDCPKPISRADVHIDEEEQKAAIVDSFPAIEAGKEKKGISSAEKKGLLGANEPIEIECSVNLSEVGSAFANGLLTPIESYFVLPENYNKPNGEYNRVAFASLLSKMRFRNRALMLLLGIGGIQRYALLMPNGRLFTLSYGEEFREVPAYSAHIDRSVSSQALALLDDTYSSVPEIVEMGQIKDRVNAWFFNRDKSKSKNPKKKGAKSTQTV